jgi:hypothetical protein
VIRKYFLVEGDINITVMFWDGNPINVQIDPSVTLEVDRYSARRKREQRIK